MTLRIPFYGPAAAGLRDDGDPEAGDLLDLLDERIYRTRWPDDPYELQFGGIAALIVCCGAWPQEIPFVRTADIEVKNVPPGANVDPARPADNGIRLGEGDYRRRVWVPEVAKMVLARVTGRIAPAEGCDRLFLRRDGSPMSGAEVLSKFNNLNDRIGVGSGLLTRRILSFFEDCATNCGDALAGAFLSRSLSAMRRARAPFGEGEPSLVKMRKAVESSHPLGRFERSMLQHVLPIERAFPDRAFRELSPEGLADVAAVRRDPHRHCYPRELVEAVFAATEGGRHEREIAAHYGIPERSVNNLLKAGTGLHFSRRRSGMGPRSSKDIFLTHARRHPGKTASDIRSWMAARVGVEIGKQSLIVIARREGVRLAHPRGALRNGRDPKRVEAHIRKNPEHTVLDVQAWARKALGREIPTQALYHFAEQRGLHFASRLKLVGATADALVAYVRANDHADIHQVVAWLEGELRTTVAIGTVRACLWRRGLKTRKLPTGRAAPYEKALLAWIEANPDAEFAEARAWLKSEFGTTLHPNTLHSFLDTHGIKLRPSKGGTRATRTDRRCWPGSPQIPTPVSTPRWRG